MKNIIASRKNLAALAGVCLAALMFGLEISSIPVVLPALEQSFHAGFSGLQWIMNAYTIACTTVLMAIGALSDRYGRKLIFLLSVVLFGIASLLCGIAQSAAVMIVFRGVQGLAGGAMLICQIATLSYQFREQKDRARVFSCWGIVFGTGLGFGPLIGGAIVAVASWQWVFLIHVFIAVLAFFLLLSGVDNEKSNSKNKLDITGMISLSMAVLFLTYFLTTGSSQGFGQPSTIGALLLCIISLFVFIVAEKRSSFPVFDFAVFRNRSFSGAILGSVGMNISFWPFMIYLPIYFQNALGYNSTTTGLSLLAYSLPTLIAPPVGERLSLRFHPRNIIPIGLFTIGIGFFVMWLSSRSGQVCWIDMLPGLLIAGTGLGITNTPVTNTSTASVELHRAGMAAGIDMSARMITLAINIALMGAILVESILYNLQSSVQFTAHPSLRSMAEKLAAGAAQEGIVAMSDTAVLNNAVANGFGVVMLYGAIGVTLMAIFSFMIFRRKASPGGDEI